MGPSRKLQCGPSAFWARSLANVRRSRHAARSSCSWATKSGLLVTGRNMRLRAADAWAGAHGTARGLGPAGPSILRAMQKPQETRPRSRSPFAAAFLSLLFPGLGHAYAGAPMRALGFAAAPILLVALLAGVLLRLDRLELLSLVLNPAMLTSVFILNLIALLYRIVAVIDAYRVAVFLNAHEAGSPRLGPARLPRQRPVPGRPAGGDPGHGRQPRRGRPLRPARPGPADQRLHLHRRGHRRRMRARRLAVAGRLRVARSERRPDGQPDPRAVAHRHPGARACPSRPGTARSASTSCSSAPTSRRAATTPTRSSWSPSTR